MFWPTQMCIFYSKLEEEGSGNAGLRSRNPPFDFFAIVWQ